MDDKIRVEIARSTHEALLNLFAILDVAGDTFDDKVYELATRAFSANSDLDRNRRTLRVRSARGQKKARRQIEIKEETLIDLQALHGRLFPYLPWTSWDWYLKELAKIAEETIHTGARDYHQAEFSEDDG